MKAWTKCKGLILQEFCQAVRANYQDAGINFKSLEPHKLYNLIDLDWDLVWLNDTEIIYPDTQVELGWELILPSEENAIYFRKAFFIWLEFRKTYAKFNQKRQLGWAEIKWSGQQLTDFWNHLPDSICVGGNWDKYPSELNLKQKYLIADLDYGKIWDADGGMSLPINEKIGWTINWPALSDTAIEFSHGMRLWLAMKRAGERLAKIYKAGNHQYF